MPIGILAAVNPINIVIEEQLQNGVIVPSKAPIIFPPIPLNLRNIFLFSLVGSNFEYMIL